MVKRKDLLEKKINYVFSRIEDHGIRPRILAAGCVSSTPDLEGSYPASRSEDVDQAQLLAGEARRYEYESSIRCSKG